MLLAMCNTLHYTCIGRYLSSLSIYSLSAIIPPLWSVADDDEGDDDDDDADDADDDDDDDDADDADDDDDNDDDDDTDDDVDVDTTITVSYRLITIRRGWYFCRHVT